MGEVIESFSGWGVQPWAPPRKRIQGSRYNRFPDVGGFFIFPEMRGQSVTQGGA